MSAVSKARVRCAGTDAAASDLDEGRRDVEAVDDASRRRPAQNLQRRSAAAAADLGDAEGRVELQRADQRFVDGRQHRLHAGELGEPFLAARGGPVGGGGIAVLAPSGGVETFVGGGGWSDMAGLCPISIYESSNSSVSRSS